MESWVIIGPLWVKYGGKTAYQPPAAQNPGNAPVPSIARIEIYIVINQNNSSKYVHIAINKYFVYKTTVMNNICPSNK